ncbi:MAG TPA: class I SAM-dependent methyltransferase [Bryobacteraceae bacterium]|nr:class I SAM-dependent methyltransferase [Bryobacteraceae bacterium]
MTPKPQIVTDLMDGYRRSKAMFAAIELGVFEATPVTAADFAASIHADPRATELLLDVCVSLGLLSCSTGIYCNTTESELFLKRTSPHTLAGYALYSHAVSWRLWHHLPDAVRQGTHRWPQAFQMEGPIFSHFFQTPESMRTFLTGLHGFGMLSSPQAIAAHDLSGVQHFVDLGGGTGHLALAFLDRYPTARASVFDLPQVIPLTRELTHNRVQCLEGDFFSDALPPADCYALARILHDWSPPKIATLLRKVYEALPPGGRLLICETLIDESHDSPTHSLLQSLNMLTCTEGQERTASQYDAICKAAGFSSTIARKTGAPVDAVLAIK